MDLFDFHFASATAVTYAIVKWLLLALLLTSSGIWNHTRYAFPLALGLVLTCVGALFKIEHWVFGDELMLAGAAATASVYALWYIAKSQREILDYLKLAWVLSACVTVGAVTFAHRLVRPLSGITEALFWAMALLLVYQRWIRRPDNAE